MASPCGGTPAACNVERILIGWIAMPAPSYRAHSCFHASFFFFKILVKLHFDEIGKIQLCLLH